MSKFKVGDKVKITHGQYVSKIGTIVKVIKAGHGEIKDHYIIQSRPGGDEMKVPKDYVAEYRQNIMESLDICYYYDHGVPRPKFEVGDVVQYTEAASDIYTRNKDFVVTEMVTVKIPSGQYYEYLIFPLDQIDNYNEKRNTKVKSSALKFKYNDKNMKEYFAESVRTNLPAWRGSTYNIINVYSDPYAQGEFDKDEETKYTKDTIPPHRMDHIIDEHTICCRIGNVTSERMNPDNDKNVSIICDKLGISDRRIKDLSKTTREKITKINLEHSTASIYILQDVIKKEFTEEEKIFLDLIDELDKERVMEKGKHKDIYKDHFPLWMTYYHIMECIKDAYTYEGIFKDGEREIRSNVDRKGNKTIELDAPTKGKCYYESFSTKYNLVIKILYNFDHNFIETAFPLGKNNNISGSWRWK